MTDRPTDQPTRRTDDRLTNNKMYTYKSFLMQSFSITHLNTEKQKRECLLSIRLRPQCSGDTIFFINHEYCFGSPPGSCSLDVVRACAFSCEIVANRAAAAAAPAPATVSVNCVRVVARRPHKNSAPNLRSPNGSFGPARPHKVCLIISCRENSKLCKLMFFWRGHRIGVQS